MKTHLRIAASVCVLSTGLMISSAGGAIAAADTGAGGSSGSSAGGQGASNAKAPAAPNVNSIGSVAENLRSSIQSGLQGFTGTINSLTKPGQLPSLLSRSPKSTFGSTPTAHGSTGTITTPPVDPTPPTDGTQTTLAANNAKKPAANANPLTAVSLAASNAASAAAANAAAAAANAQAAAAAAASAASAAASNAITTAAETVAVPVAQVVTSVQDMITSVSNAGVALSQLPTDLSSLLGVGAVDPSATTVGGTGHLLLPPSAGVPVTTTLFAPPAPIGAAQGTSGLPAATTVAPVTPLDFSPAQASNGATSSAATQPASNDARANDVLSMVEHVIGAFVASVSLTALLAVALPGLAALLGTCFAGIRVGYRQAKAGAELPDTAISRFVGSGPVGVVRSSSQIALRTRIVRADRPAPEQPRRARTLRLVRPASASAELLDHAV